MPVPFEETPFMFKQPEEQQPFLPAAQPEPEHEVPVELDAFGKPKKPITYG